MATATQDFGVYSTPAQLVQPPTNVPVGSPEWWAYQLSAELDRRAPLVWLYEDYYEGRHKLTFASSRFREAFGSMLAAVSDNWIPLVINASVERLKPQGFLFGESREGDKEAWRIFQDNHLDADSPLGFTEAGKHGEASLLVWSEKTGRGANPEITVEHPAQMVIRREAGNRRKRAAAFKRWTDDTGAIYGTLYLPSEIYRLEFYNNKWQARRGAEYQSKHPLGVVPVIPLVNDPHILPCYPPSSLTAHPHGIPAYSSVGLGRSDMVDVISTTDQINKLICDMLVASEVAAYRQRWATGLEVPRYETDHEDPEKAGKPMEPFSAAVDRLWIAEGEDGERVKFGEFSATDLSNYTQAIEQRIQSLAARTRTPPHYLLGNIVNASGDALKAAETGLASKVRGKQASYGEALEEAMRLAFAWKGDARKDDTSAEVDWAHAESRSESEYVDSLVKKMAFGVPKEQLWKDAGYSPQEIQRFKTMLLEEASLGIFDEPAEEAPVAEPPVAA